MDPDHLATYFMRSVRYIQENLDQKNRKKERKVISGMILEFSKQSGLNHNNKQKNKKTC